MLVDEHGEKIQAILSKYPEGYRRAAVMPLLYLAQSEDGHLSSEAVDDVAGILGLDSTEVAHLIKFYTLFHHEREGKCRVQVCTDLPCALRGAEAFAKELSERLGIGFGETTADGKVTLEEVMCLAACDRAPMMQIQDRDGIHYHEHLTVDSAMEIIEALGKQADDE